MGRVSRPEWLCLLLVICAALSYALALHVLTVVVAPAPNLWWSDQWSVSLALGVSLGVFLIASVSRWTFFLVVNFSLCFAGLAGYFIGSKSVVLNDDIMAALLETSPPEAIEFVSSTLIVTVVATLVIGFFVTIPYVVYYRSSLFRIALRTILAALIFAIANLTVPQALVASTDVFIPASLGIQTYKYYLTQKKLNEEIANRFDIATLPSSMDPKTSGDLTVVLVVGESARADHFSLNGYHRDTNAYTKKETGLISFRNVISCGATTRIAVPCLLTRATLLNPGLRTRETSLLNLAKKHGFYTTWISNNDIPSSRNLPIASIANSADKRKVRTGMEVDNRTSTDLYLLSYFHETIDRQKNVRQLIVVHLRGSHFSYINRYPKEFSNFEPDECDDLICTINSYDNSILFTDYILSQLIGYLKDREALLFYVSDHGESLGETDEHGQVYWKHGESRRVEQRIVPMQAWASSLFIAKYPERFAAMARRATSPLSHDHLFHSILDCIGIHSDVVDRHLSLCTQGNFTQRGEFFVVDNLGKSRLVLKAGRKSQGRR